MATTLKNHIEVFEMITKFKNTENIDIAYSQIMRDICDFFEFDSVFTARRDNMQNKTRPIMSYKRDESIKYHDNNIRFNSFINLTTVCEVGAKERTFIHEVEQKHFYTKKELTELKDMFAEVSYIVPDHVEQAVIFYVNNEDLFAYSVFEIHDANRKFFSDDAIILESICDVIALRSDKVVSERRRFNEKNITDAIIKNEEMPICLVEKEGQKIIYYNDLYKKALPSIELGESFYRYYDEDEDPKVYTIKTVKVHHEGFGDKYWIKKSIPFQIDNGKDVYMIYAKDTSEFIKQLDHIDTLTTAFSLKEFCEYAENKVPQSKDCVFYIATIDIDKFKYINNTFGFDVGNQVLKKVSNTIAEFTSELEAYARINEDKFVVLLQCDSKNEVIKRLNDLFLHLEERINAHFTNTNLTFTCGVIEIIDRTSKINTLVDYANQVRKSIKGSLENTIAFFDGEIQKQIETERRIEAKIAHAIENDEFIPYLQPKFEIATGKIRGAEALVRWISSDGIIYPDQFIPLFERNGFISKLDFIVYKKVMQHLRECLDLGIQVYPISINVSRNHLKNKYFVEQIMSLINKYEIPVELIELEVTESVFVADKEVLKEFIGDLKKPRLKVSIDDFGTAYSSLQILTDIDVDILKIDKGFLENIDFTTDHTFSKDEIVLKNIIHLAKDLGAKVICEGIETKEQLELLNDLGCEYGQGYLFAKPMCIADYKEQFLQGATKEL